MAANALNARACPVCDTSGFSKIYCERNIDLNGFSETTFASRKMPEFMCHQLVVCPHCETVYAPHPPTATALHQCYEAAAFDSREEAQYAAQTYHDALAPYLKALPHKTYAIEVGSGTGAFLEHLLAYEFQELIGLEPSHAAIAAAQSHIKPYLHPMLFENLSLFANSSSLIACFQTLEHLSNPREFVQQAWTRLKPGGLLAIVTHDYKSVVNRLLGKRSPIVDIEHLQLFCKKSLLHLLHEVGFTQIQQQGIYNCYPLSYWIKLTPFPKSFKMALLAFLTKHPSANRNIKVPVGNVLTVAYKPVLV